MAGARFGFSISPGEPLGVSQEVAYAEALGHARVGIWDSPALFREPWVVLAAASLDELAPGSW